MTKGFKEHNQKNTTKYEEHNEEMEQVNNEKVNDEIKRNDKNKNELKLDQANDDFFVFKMQKYQNQMKSRRERMRTQFTEKMIIAQENCA